MSDTPVPAGRVPPHSIDAERSLLGGILLENGQDKNGALDDLLAFLAAEDFYREAHRKIFEAMLVLHEKQEPIDRVTVKAALIAMGALDAVGGEMAIDLLDTVVPSASNLGIYGTIIHEKALARRLIEAAHAISSNGYEGGDVGELLDDAEQRILAVAERTHRKAEASDSRTVMRDTMKQIEKDYERGEEITGVRTGILELDLMTSGFQPGDLVILAARPGQGKTTAGMCWVTHVATRPDAEQGKPDPRRGAYFVSMEMPKVQIGKRQLSALAKVSLQRIRNGRLIDSDWGKLAKAAGEIAGANIELDDSRGLSALDIRSRARRVARRWASSPNPLGLIVVDYLTLMAEDARAENKSVAVGRNAKRLKELAGELNVPIICLAQLNRENVKGGKPRRPVLSDLRDSGEIEQHCDTAIFLHHEAPPNDNDPDQSRARPETVEIIVEKQRNGAVGTIHASHVWDLCLIEGMRRGDYRPHYTEGGQ